MGTRAVDSNEVNANNYVLWEGATLDGATPSLYHLNRFVPSDSPSQLTFQQPWTQYGNTVIDPSNLQAPQGVPVAIAAQNIILAAGAIGTTRILANTAKSGSPVANSHIGKGLFCHPSMPIIGLFEKQIDMLEGLDSSVFVDTFALQPGFIFETMTGLPAYGAILIPGDGKQVYENVGQFN